MVQYNNKPRFDGRVAIITGAGGGLGRAYALLLASLGASVVVNDLGGSRHGEGASTLAADKTVSEIQRLGGKAVADYHSVEEGEKIVQTALNHFGKADILINNAGILQDRSFVNMTKEDWQKVLQVHLHGAFAITKAAWDVFIKRGYGRIVMTASAAGIYGNFGQANYSAAKMALIGFSHSLAREGAHKNIFCNAIAPLAGSRITETVMPKELLDGLKPEFVAPFVAWLVHEHCTENGGLYEMGAGFAAKLRWERSKGALFKVDHPSFTPSAVLCRWNEIVDFHHPDYPSAVTDVNWMDLVEKSVNLTASANPCGSPVSFKGKVALITGAGGGLGRGYALLLGSLGVSVVVNDVGESSRSLKGVRPADAVVSEIRTHGGTAVANYDSVEDGQAVVSTALKAYGRLDIVINNAGILRDRSFSKMTIQEWQAVVSVHLNGTFSVARAAWPIFIEQGYGRMVNTTSAVGLYGNFGQTNYSSAKAAVLALSHTLAAEGRKHNILVNTIAPNAGTAMTATIMPSEVVRALKPEYVAPLVAVLCSDACPESGSAFEAGSGWFAKVRWQRSIGHRFPVLASHGLEALPLEMVAAEWHRAVDFAPGGIYPTTPQESFAPIYKAMSNSSALQTQKMEGMGQKPYMLVGFPNRDNDPSLFTYTSRDVILYNLGIGASAEELHWVYENHELFGPVPTFGVVVGLSGMKGGPNWAAELPEFNPMALLHGEQYLALHTTLLPSAARIRSAMTIKECSNKGAGKGVVVILESVSQDAKTGQPLFTNESTLFIRGISLPPSKVKAAVARPKAATESVTVPSRAPDMVISQRTDDRQAALYRLSGDLNPLHIDPSMARLGGFSKPILHGLCTFGFAGKHILEALNRNLAPGNPRRTLSVIKGRFTKHVFPGETLVTEMWFDEGSDSRRMIFQVRVRERNGEVVLNNALAEWVSGGQSSLDTSSGVTGRQPGKAVEPTIRPLNAVPVSSQGTGPIESLVTQLQETLATLPPDRREALVREFNSTIQFQLETGEKGGKPLSLYIDLRDGIGSISAGASPSPADLTVTVSVVNFMRLVNGTMTPQDAFMKGFVKIKGKTALVMNLDHLLRSLRPLAKFEAKL